MRGNGWILAATCWLVWQGATLDVQSTAPQATDEVIEVVYCSAVAEPHPSPPRVLVRRRLVIGQREYIGIVGRFDVDHHGPEFPAVADPDPPSPQWSP